MKNFILLIIQSIVIIGILVIAHRSPLSVEGITLILLLIALPLIGYYRGRTWTDGWGKE